MPGPKWCTCRAPWVSYPIIADGDRQPDRRRGHAFRGYDKKRIVPFRVPVAGVVTTAPLLIYVASGQGAEEGWVSMNDEKAAGFRELVLERLAALSGAAADKVDNARPVELDQTRLGRLSRQDALQSQALSVASLERNRAEIGRLRAALARIDSGDYGWCEECGEAIPNARLKIDPAAVHCVSCAEKRETHRG